MKKAGATNAKHSVSRAFKTCALKNGVAAKLVTKVKTSRADTHFSGKDFIGERKAFARQNANVEVHNSQQLRTSRGAFFDFDGALRKWEKAGGLQWRNYNKKVES